MTKHAIIENITKQMSGNTNTHNVYNNYVHMPKQEAEASAYVDIDAKLEKQQEAAEEAVYTHRVRKMSKAQKNRHLVRDHLKSTIPQTQAAEAADAHMQDNYIQPGPLGYNPSGHERHEPEPPPPNEKVEMASSSNSTPTPFAGGRTNRYANY